MNTFSLTAISPLDGRYLSKVEELIPYFSEFGFFKYRIEVEIEYFITLVELALPPLKNFPKDQFDSLRGLYTSFSVEDAVKIKQIEKRTNHDIKAVEYFLREKFEELKINKYAEFIHFGLTSQDINNTAIPLMCKHALEEVYLPVLRNLLIMLKRWAAEWRSVAMLSRTHGQPASPTTLGKEMDVFCYRVERQLGQFDQFTFMAKFSGATGNFNAHLAAFPDIHWERVADRFIERFGLKRLQLTTQIDSYDDLAGVFQWMKRINTILIDLCRDIWTYISLEYFSQRTVETETGSSVMPHKVNPIDFENAEGNLGMANAVLTFLADKLPLSRLQRDLTDSTVLRNIGLPFGHSLVAFKAIILGWSKLQVNLDRLHTDLESNWQVVSEAYQTILRREGVPNSFELLKSITRGNKKITREVLHKFIDSLDLPESVKKEMKAISPQNYTGTAHRKDVRHR